MSVEHIQKQTDKMSPQQCCQPALCMCHVHELVCKTVGHPQYALHYSFPSHEEGWMVTKLRKKVKAMRSNAMIAVDCEMVLYEDGTDALDRVCVVDSDLQSLLGNELRKEGAPLDCVEDARAAMKLVLAKMEKGLEKNTIPVKQNDLHLETDAIKLLCHRIPISIPGEKLLEAIPEDFTIKLKSNKKAGGNKYSALAVFKNKQEADEAFDGLNGEQVKDSSGRPQKLISFKLESGVSGNLYVRKRVQDGDDNDNNNNNIS